jgi:phthalate 4,5-dioxygenase oxygenase subunit
VTISWKKMSKTPPLANGKLIPGMMPAMEFMPNATDWYGRFRPVQNEANDYLIDREAQRNGTIFSGITHVHMQDQAVTESMGPITDHTLEHLAPSDQMIARTRRRLVHAARALRDKGTIPPGVDNPSVYLQARSGECVLDTKDWREAYADRLQHVIRPTGYSVAAE